MFSTIDVFASLVFRT